MKRNNKLFIAIVTTTILAICTVSAQGKMHNGQGNSDFRGGNKFEHSDFRGGPNGMPNGNFMPGNNNHGCEFLFNAEIGQVSEVKADYFTFKDAEGNTITVKVCPFTKFISGTPGSSKEKRPNCEEAKISDLKAGDWVAVSSSNPSAKTKYASIVLIAK